MKAWIAILAISGLASLLGCAIRIDRTAPYKWDIRGAIVSVESDAVVVRHKSGQRVRLVIDSGTEILIGGRPAAPVALSVGKRVTVDVETDAGGVTRARRVQMSR